MVNQSKVNGSTADQSISLTESLTDDVWWRKRLEQIVPIILPTDTVNRSTKSCQLECYARTFTDQQTKLIEKFTKDSGTSLITFFDAVCRVVLSRYSQQSDLSLLVSRTENSIDTSLVTRLELNCYETFSQLVNQLQKVYYEGSQHICGLSQTIKQIARTIEPQSLNVHLIEQQKKCKSFSDNSDHELIVSCVKENNCLEISFCYDSGLFKELTIKRMATHLFNFTIEVINSPLVKLDDIDLADDEERRLIRSFNPEFPSQLGCSLFIEMFYQSVKNNKNRQALRKDSHVISYTELNERSNQLANYLQDKRNVKRGDMVAILLPQGIDYFIAILSTLKLGAAFIPIDIDYPIDRVKYILSDCGSPILITEQCFLKSVQLEYENSILLSNLEDNFNSYSKENHPIVSSDDDLAYCMYTSGSTGQPKGVLIAQKTVSYMVTSFCDIFKLNQDTRSSLISNTAFDAVICESFPTLVQGGLLITVDHEKRYNPSYLVDWLVANEINYCYLPSRILEIIFENNLHLRIKSPLKVWASGEQLNSVKITENLSVFNILGMTELTPLTFVSLNSLLPDDYHRPPIGRPVPGVKAHILDNSGRLTPIKVIGELYYSSPFVAKGYHNLPEKTLEKFSVDRFTDNSESRLLRSGDLARWREDGLIEFFGRADAQIKIRGYRVELTEIEELLKSHPFVHQSVVLVKGDRQHDPRIVAFVILSEEGNKLANNQLGKGLHDYLRKNLPYFMLPQIFTVQEFPLNENGKLDKETLLLINMDPLISSSFELPQTQMQLDLIKVWSEHLDVPIGSLGINDNYFELGGHSLLAAVIASVLNQPPYNYPVTTRMILKLGTIRLICETIGDQCSQKPIEPIPIIEKRFSVQLSPAQSWINWLEMGFAEGGLTNEFFYYNIPKGIDWPAVEDAINCLIQRHEALRITMKRVQFTTRQSAASHKRISIPLFKYDKVSEALEQTKKLCQSHRKIFEGDQLVKFNLIELPCYRLIVMIANHLIMDGSSWEIMKRELKTIFNSYVKGTSPVLPNLKINYLDYVSWENRVFYRDAELMREAKKFWAQWLSDFQIPMIPLPQSITAWSGTPSNYYYLWFDDEVTAKVEKIIKNNRTTLFVFTQTILLSVLHRYTGQTDLTIYTAAAIRSHPWAHQLVGQFAQFNFSRVKWEGSPIFNNLLRIVHSSVMQEQEYRFYPYQKVIEAISGDVFPKTVPVQLAQSPDLSEPADFMTGSTTPMYSLNALSVHFMRCQGKYSIELNFSKNCFQESVKSEFSETMREFIKRVIVDPTKKVDSYFENPFHIEVKEWKSS